MGLTLVSVMAFATPAHADPENFLENEALNTLCVDDSHAYGLRMFDCNGSNYQRWHLGAATNQHYPTMFQNSATGRCLDDSRYGLRVIACNGTVWQTWVPRQWPDGTWQFQNRGTGLCLGTDHYASVHTRSCTSSEWQSWYRHY